jgi:ABC-type transport system involved in Fe-S cluster assembly fused permease/ATPase subunit
MTKRKISFAYLKNHLDIIYCLLPFIWVKDWSIRLRYVILIFLTTVMIGLNILAPIMLMNVVALFSKNMTTTIQIYLALLTYGTVWTLAQITALVREIFLFKAVERSVRLICLEISSHLHKLPYHFYSNQKTGALVSYIEKTYRAFPNVFWGFTLNIIPTILEVMIATSIIWYWYGSLLGLTLITTIAIFIIFSLFTTEVTSKAQSYSNENHFKVNAHLVDGLMNTSLIRYFGKREYEREQIDRLLKSREETEVKSQLLMQYVRLGQTIIIGVSLISITWLAGKGVIAKNLSIPDFVLINSYVLQFAVPLFFFGFIFKDMRKGLTDMEQLVNLLRTKREVDGKRTLPSISHKEEWGIQFKKVSFSYGDRQVLKDVSFEISPGKTVALVGSSGSGKSTISNLLFRFYETSSGEITIDKKNIKDYSLSDLTEVIGIVPQNTSLFNNTILYNICYGNSSASEQEIEETIRIVELEALIKSLPNKLLTQVGERGITLSEGEKQRLSMARIILKKPKIYIFDEATSFLDLNTEKFVQRNIRKITQGATTLIIAHRLSTIVDVDYILVLHKGMIGESGTHEELIKQNGIYYNLWSAQAHLKVDKPYSQAI